MSARISGCDPALYHHITSRAVEAATTIAKMTHWSEDSTETVALYTEAIAYKIQTCCNDGGELMSYTIIHEIKTATVETAGYGYCMKAIFDAIKTSITEAGGTVAETINTESATVYNITWVINGLYKVQFYNSNATVYQWNFFGAAGTEYRNTNTSNMLTNTATSFTFFYHIYLGTSSMEYVISGAGSTVTGWVKNTIEAIMTTYTDSNGDIMPLIQSQSNGSSAKPVILALAVSTQHSTTGRKAATTETRKSAIRCSSRPEARSATPVLW